MLVIEVCLLHFIQNLLIISPFGEHCYVILTLKCDD